jgi:hypothetical protein
MSKLRTKPQLPKLSDYPDYLVTITVTVRAYTAREAEDALEDVIGDALEQAGMPVLLERTIRVSNEEDH